MPKQLIVYTAIVFAVIAAFAWLRRCVGAGGYCLRAVARHAAKNVETPA